MHHLLVILLAIGNPFLPAVFSLPAQAENRVLAEPAFVPIDAQALIDHCWDISLKLRSGSTESARHGFVESVACLRKAIVEQTIPMFEPGVLTPAYAEWLLMEVAEPYAAFFDRLYNVNKHCFCGTMFTSIDLWAVSQLYEQILHDVVDQRNKYQL